MSSPFSMEYWRSHTDAQISEIVDALPEDDPMQRAAQHELDRRTDLACSRIGFALTDHYIADALRVLDANTTLTETQANEVCANLRKARQTLRPVWTQPEPERSPCNADAVATVDTITGAER